MMFNETQVMDRIDQKVSDPFWNGAVWGLFHACKKDLIRENREASSDELNKLIESGMADTIISDRQKETFSRVFKRAIGQEVISYSTEITKICNFYQNIDLTPSEGFKSSLFATTKAILSEN